MPTIKIIPKYKCKYCDVTKQCKETFDRHMIVCKYMNLSAKERDMQIITLPSQQVMFQMLLDLSVKYEKMEKKMEKIQANQACNMRRSILEHLPALNTSFSKWINVPQINKHHLKIFFDITLIDAIKQCISEMDYSMKIPIRNYTQNPQKFYIYEMESENIFKWRLMTPQDWEKWVKTISVKIKHLYNEWKKENQNEIDSNDTLFELNFTYVRKFNDLEKEMNSCIKQIRQMIVGKIQTTFTIVE
jgi:hypothetical protein